MGDNSFIEWCDATWPIVQGCDPVSPGCALCYVPPLLWRFAHNPNPTISLPVLGLAERPDGGRPRFTGRVALRRDRLDWPRKWKRPRRIFVPSHGDLFHKDVPDEFLHQVYHVMESCHWHTFQVLTKRPKRMREYLSWRWGEGRIPSRHIWHGVSAEDQIRLNERIEDLLATPSAVRFLSLEPLLGPIMLPGGIWCRHHQRFEPTCCMDESQPCFRWQAMATDMIDWAIVGGESGRGARPMHPAWARSLRDQCQDTGIAFFFKQWGEFRPTINARHPDVCLDDQGKQWPYPSSELADAIQAGTQVAQLARVGKKGAGRVLDGRTWDEFPAASATMARA